MRGRGEEWLCFRDVGSHRMGDSVLSDQWPPEFSLVKGDILNLLIGESFYTNPSAALREAILNAIDAVRCRPDIEPEIDVVFDRDDCTLTVSDNGIGMNQEDIVQLFVKVGASAARLRNRPGSVGTFGIGVISYFMAGDEFTLETYDGQSTPVGLRFTREMLTEGRAEEVSSTRKTQGTTVTIQVRDMHIFDNLMSSFDHWCRDVEGLVARVLPGDHQMNQGGAPEGDPSHVVTIPELPGWVEQANLSPISELDGWEGMSGNSTVSVLYRGVFVQECTVSSLWGIQGSIDVDPDHFKPQLNREGFVGDTVEKEVQVFLHSCHPLILERLVEHMRDALRMGELDRWTTKRWANLWLAVPRSPPYQVAVKAWDAFFRRLPAFELANTGDGWEPESFNTIVGQGDRVFVAPLEAESASDVVRAAVRFLRNTSRTVIRGIRWDKSWMRDAGRMYGTTADLIASVFANELPELVVVANQAEIILAEIQAVAILFHGPPPVELARLGANSQPAVGVHKRLIINVDHEDGRALVEHVLRVNEGPMSLVGGAARHTYQQLTQVAAVANRIDVEAEILGPIRRRYVRSIMP